MAALDVLFLDTLAGLLLELVDGPDAAAFVLNPGDRGLLGSLRALPATQASTRPDGRSSAAAHVQHLRYGLELLNRWASGDDPFADADYAAHWAPQEVTEEDWQALRDALEHQARAWMVNIATPRTWDPTTLAGAISSVIHLGYHLGAIRQIAPAAAGPPAKD